MQSTGLMVFWLVVVLAMIPASLWLLKRSGMVGNALKGGGPAVLQTVAQTNVGPGQRVVTVELNAGGERTWLVLGVTQQQITALHTLAAPAGSASPQTSAQLPPAAQAFSSLLRRTSDRVIPPSA
ncbi:MAG TPA: flagellar biosynthetic protein FliO [Aquabacterium sp.]|uniref:FliO/MopB family protein n=1 Tax=Aquabacterium sp. TaxID=1872578 RepID=UPI002E31BE55|nr:flagellar biosynthetic protein FliO [Aquabacterium sp.]HEX5373149.1 flagellar biosynthetic protein FliO [Aquabacterium sp.]